MLEELGQPAPLAHVGLGPEAQRAILLEQPLHGFERHPLIGKRRDIAVAELTAIAVARARAYRRFPLEQRHTKAGLEQPPGRSQADHTAADDNYLLHDVPLHYSMAEYAR